MKKGGLGEKPRTISRFWLRRLCETALFGCFTIVILYIWARFIPTGYQLPIGLSVTDLTAAIAAIGSLVSLILCFWLPKNNETAIAIFVYLLSAAVAAIAVCTSGGPSSPFLAVWIVAAIFSGFFGAIVISSIAILVAIQTVIAAIQTGFNVQTIIGYLFFGFAPLIFSFILWSRRQPAAEGSDYADLADRLSTVEGKSEVVINTIDDGVLAISRQGNIELINPSAQRIIGWDQGDALGLNWKSVLKLASSDGKDVAEIDNPVAQALISNKPTHSDKLFLITSSEKRILVSIVSSPVGKDGEGIIVVFRDITREKAEERQQAEFISTASHEMRTPVASIEGYLGLALNPATAHIDEKARDFITKAHKSARHLGKLFQDLLDISKAEDGRLKNEPKVIDVNEFVKEIFDGLAQKAAEKKLDYIFNPAVKINDDGSEKSLQPIFYANVDPDHFREVISNLIENAIKYTPYGEVVVDITGDEKQISVSVKDSGIGIPKEDIPHLFQKFYRVNNSDTQEINGTGLGLYLSRRLAEAMSGNLHVESEYKKGSMFFLDIPRMSNIEAKRKLEESQIDPATKEVSDELEIQMQAMTMPQEIAASTASTESSHANPVILSSEPAKSDLSPMQTLAPTPTTQIPTRPPDEIASQAPAPPQRTSITPQEPSAQSQEAPAQPAAKPPTLAEIEDSLNTQRSNLSIPDRK